MKVNPIGYAIAVSLLLILYPLCTAAQIPQPVAIPEGLSEVQRDELRRQRSDLDIQRKTIAGKIATHNRQCSSVPKNTPLEKECGQRKAELEKEKASYIERVIIFNQAVANYEQTSKQLIKITPYTVRLGSVWGEFSIENSDGSRLTNANIRAGQIAQVDSGTRVITEPTGHIQFILPDETTFTIGPNADIVMDDFVFDTDMSAKKISVQVMKGIFRWVTGKVSRKDPANMRVKTPTIGVGIRGTDFETFVKADGSGYIKLFSGVLEITPQKGGAMFVMKELHMVTSEADGTLSKPEPI